MVGISDRQLKGTGLNRAGRVFFKAFFINVQLFSVLFETLYLICMNVIFNFNKDWLPTVRVQETELCFGRCVSKLLYWLARPTGNWKEQVRNPLYTYLSMHFSLM